MKYAVLALAGLAPTIPVSASAAENVQASSPPRAEARAQVTAAAIQDEPERSQDASRVADWVARSQDNRSLPYAIIDKKTAALFLFDAKGTQIGRTPVLVGVAIGDEATPGIGGKNLSEIGPAEKTTPAGRFVAKYGYAVGKQRVLWVDYATSVALHPVPNTNKKERRPARLLSPTPDDNRITFGCINVSLRFYNGKVRPLFQKKGGVVYVLPETKTLEETFPRLRVQPFLNGGSQARE
ncbi:hypothetical protein [Novosphingobium sp. BL-52-GroH]|uniref:hypothetical protein n=1 Tax=Novosphingobium sp. BL-52-GroH TaxID=3349877 RepID=UPI00384ECE41